MSQTPVDSSAFGRRCVRWAALACAALTLLVVPAKAGAQVSQAPFSDGGVERLGEQAAGRLPAGFTDTTVWNNLFLPTTLRWAPDGRVFVAHLNGVVSVFDNTADPTPTTYADLRQQVYTFADKGLIGMALDPRFTTGRPYVYVLYTYDKDPNSATFPRWNDDCPTPPGADADGCVDSARLSRLDPDGTEHVLIEDWCGQFSTHSVGALNFGPDGALYASAGDGASYIFADYGQAGSPVNPCGDPPGGVGGNMTPPSAEGGALRSQSFRRAAGRRVSLDGSIIRVDADTGDALPDNPAAGDADANRRRIVAYGMRNPFRFTFRPGTDEIWFGDVGWNVTEEVNRIPDVETARNYGWPCYEGAGRMGAYDTLNLASCESLYQAGTATPPYFAYQHGDILLGDSNCAAGTSSTTGLAFYTGAQFPAEYHGALFGADYARRCLFVIPRGPDGLPDTERAEVFESGAAGPVDLQQGPDGALYYVDLEGGSIHKIAYPAGNQAPTASATATPDHGPLPLTVTFDGSGSSDSDAAQLLYSWDLDGDGTFDDSTDATVEHTYTAPGNYTAQLRVTDSDGASDTISIPITAGDAPEPTIDAPTAAFTWATGDTIHFSGSAVDGEGNPIPASGLVWRLNIRHCSRNDTTNCHTHLGSAVQGVSAGTFIAPDHDYPSHLVLELTATDANGLHFARSLELQPKTVDLTFASDPAGAQLTAGADTAPGPFTHRFIQNSTTTITAETPQNVGGLPYALTGWSDGGASTHAITVPRTDTTYTASFARVTEVNLAGADVIGTNTSSAAPGKAEAYRTVASTTGTVSTLRLYVDAGSTANRLVAGLYSDAGNTPGTLLAQAQTSTVTPGAWNELTLPGDVRLAASTPYWISFLNPSDGSGTLRWRDRAGGSGGPEQTSPASPLLSTLPSTWTRGSVWADGPVSAYAFGSPADVTAPATLAVSPTSLSFSGIAGAASPASRTVTVTNAGDGALAFTAADDAPWLSVTPASGTAPRDLTVAVDSTGLTAGTYTATVTVTSSGSAGSPKLIPVTLVVSPPAPPVLAVAPTSLAFSGVAGGSGPVAQTLAVSNTGGGALAYSASKDAPWLSVSPETGVAPGTVTVSVNTAGLAAGTHTSSVRISSGGATGSPRDIPVTLTLAQAPPPGTETLAGASVIGTNTSSANPGAGEAYRIASAIKTGSVNKLRLYVDGASTATQLVLGLYADAGGNPTTLLGAGSLVGVTPGAWNEVTLPSNIAITGGSPYWFALLNPAGGSGTLRWRDRAGGSGGPEQGSAGRTLATLPSTWAASSNWSDGPVSGYAVGSSSTPAPVIGVAPASLSFSGQQGAANPASKALAITNTGGGTLAFTVSDDAPWLAVTPASASAPQALAAAVDTAGLAPGTYTATITVTAPGATGSPATIPVTLTVDAPPPSELAVSHSSLSFSATAGAADPDRRSVTVSNAGPGTLSFTASANVPWLSVSPSSGQAPATLDVGVQTAGLAPGTHSGTITIAAAGALGSPKTVAVTLELAPEPALTIAPGTLAFTAVEDGENPAARTVEVTNSGAGTLAFDTSADAAWLSVDPSGGVTPSDLSVSVDTTGLVAGEYHGTVSVTAASGAPRTIGVTLTVESPPPPVLTISPDALSFSTVQGGAAGAGKAIAVTNGGSGMLAYTVSTDAAWLEASQTGHGAPSTVTVVADPAGLAAGTYTGAVMITSLGAIGSPKTVAVTFTVQPPPTSGLVGAWGFDEASGVTAADASGNGNVGTIAGAVRSGSGRFGGALSFTAANQWVTVPSSPSLNLTTGMTVESWVRPNVLNNSWRTVAVKETSAGLAWALYAAESGGLASGHATTALGERWASGASALPLSTWSHIAVTYDASTIRFYVNGVQVGSRAQSGPLLTSSLPLRFGGNAVWPEWYRGLLDEIRIYNRPLSAVEIQADMTRPATVSAMAAGKRAASLRAKRGRAVSKPAKIKRFRGKHRHGFKVQRN